MKKVILLHGLIGSLDQMLPLKKNLDSSFEVYILEFDGLGRKSSINQPFSTSSFVSQLNSFIHDVAEPVHIFGHSIGGLIALLAAGGGNERIKSITTLGSKFFWGSEVASDKTETFNLETLKEKIPEFFQLLEKRHGEYWVDVLSRTSDFIQSLRVQGSIKQEFVKCVNASVQLLVGEKDTIVSKQETEMVAGWIPHARFEVLPGVDHPIEKVDLNVLSKKISSFL